MRIRRFGESIHDLSLVADHIVVVVGGAGSHYFIGPGRDHGMKESECDAVGIQISHIAARVVQAEIQKWVHGACARLSSTLDDVRAEIGSARCVVVGPVVPSALSSDSVASLLAETCDAELLVYVKEGRLQERSDISVEGDTVAADALWQIAYAAQGIAGRRSLIDIVALQSLRRTRFKSSWLSFHDLNRLVAICLGERSPACEILGEGRRKWVADLDQLQRVSEAVIADAAAYYHANAGGPSHSLAHTTRVVQQTERLAKIYWLSSSCLTSIAAWWHDVGRLVGPARGHEARSANLMVERLRQDDLSPNVVLAADDAVRFHKWSMAPTSLEGKVVRDADKLDFVSSERWEEWNKLIAGGGVVDLEVLADLSQKIPRLEDILMLDAAREMAVQDRRRLQGKARAFDETIRDALIL